MPTRFVLVLRPVRSTRIGDKLEQQAPMVTSQRVNSRCFTKSLYLAKTSIMTVNNFITLTTISISLLTTPTRRYFTCQWQEALDTLMRLAPEPLFCGGLYGESVFFANDLRPVIDRKLLSTSFLLGQPL